MITKNKNILSIIIINYNLSKEIENCLNSFFANINIEGQGNYEIIIVDNNSSDKSLPEVEAKFKKDNIKFYYLDKNEGFGKGCNYGFSKSSGEYICFLNPDTIIKEDVFSPILDLLERDQSIGIVGPKQQIRNHVFDLSAGFFPNIFLELFNSIGIGVFFEGFIVTLYSKLKKNKSFEVDWILGAVVFIRSEIFEKINGFDKDYFMFFEEVDLCKRVSDLGFKIIYSPQLRIHHIGSVSGKKDYKLYTIRVYSSKFIYISKHFKMLNKLVMKSLMYVQLFFQILIWTILLSKDKVKSKQKLSAFFYLMKNNFRAN
jgi:GT2 family glycosyltransferase